MSAHDLERTRVTVQFGSDGSYIVEVANDPAWLLLRLEPFAGRTIPANLSPAQRDRRLAELTGIFVDRVVLFVDQHEVRPTSVEYIPSEGAFRLRGRLPPGARTLRWFYGLVIDPYPLTIRAADGTSQIYTIAGEAWSESIAMPQFASRRTRVTEAASLVVLFAVLVGVRFAGARRRRKAA